MIVAVAAFSAGPARAEDYVPLTEEEAAAYVATLTQEQIVQEIIKLDLIEHSVPVLSGLSVAAVLGKDGSLIIWYPDVITMTIGPLAYGVAVSPQKIENFTEEKRGPFFSFFLAPLLCAAAAEISTAIGGGRDPWQYLAAGMFGVAVGAMIDVFFALNL